MKNKEKITKYEDIRKDLQTFDVINCLYGTEWYNPMHWVMRAIGHTAMVYVCEETGQIFVYESTQTSRGDGKTGVQLRPMGEWVDSYPGQIRIRKTIIEDPELRAVAELKASDHIKKYRGTPYPPLNKLRWLWFMANAAIDVRWGLIKKAFENKATEAFIYCTMLFGHWFKYCGLIFDVLNEAELEPDDTRPGSDSLVTVYFVKGVSLGPEIQIK